MGDQPSTRERILDAAQRRFASASYEQVGLRDIAGDVGIDVAYVHRTFGSKERLFIEVLRQSFLAEREVLVMAPGLVDRLVEDVFASSSTCISHIDPLSIVIHSLSSPAAQSVLREFILEEFIAPLSALHQGDGAQRASMMAALLLGIRILRDVIELKGLDNAHRSTLEPLVTRMLRVCLTDSTAS